MLEKEFQYFLDHKPELISKYLGKYIVIKGEEVVGVYSSEEEAYFESAKKFEAGTFLIQLCDKNGKTTQTFHSRVSFS